MKRLLMGLLLLWGTTTLPEVEVPISTKVVLSIVSREGHPPHEHHKSHKKGK